MNFTSQCVARTPKTPLRLLSSTVAYCGFMYNAVCKCQPFSGLSSIPSSDGNQIENHCIPGWSKNKHIPACICHILYLEILISIFYRKLTLPLKVQSWLVCRWARVAALFNSRLQRFLFQGSLITMEMFPVSFPDKFFSSSEENFFLSTVPAETATLEMVVMLNCNQVTWIQIAILQFHVWSWATSLIVWSLSSLHV